ncbi:MAG: alpha/beta hydrolase-fold protein [Oscillospiraceae bacterium]
MANMNCSFYSCSLNMTTNINVIIPDRLKNDELDVLYLLHGLSDNSTCYGRLTAVERYALEHNVAVIIPEVQRSFYFDMKYGMNYFQYVSTELIDFAHSMFNLPNSREKSYIAGLSMGGYGALKCALRKPEQYKACASFSSVCDIKNMINEKMPAANVDQLIAVLGQDLKVPETDDLYLLSLNLPKTCRPKIFMTCGTEDMLYPQNQSLKSHFEKNGYDITFNEWEGDHNWDFWEQSLKIMFDFYFGQPQSFIKTPLSKSSR